MCCELCVNTVYVWEVFGRTNGRSFRVGAYPPLNVWDDDNNLYVEAEVPGMELDELEIFVNGDDQLTIQGERKQPDGEERAWHRQERGYGKFARLIQLPSDVESEKVAAEYQDGVLLVTLPKKEEAKPRRIEVQTGS